MDQGAKMGMIREFKEFAVKGNVMDFKNLFLTLREGTGVPGPYLTLADAQKAGAVTMNIGLFVTTMISFIIIAFAVFLLVRAFNKLRANA